MTIFRAAGLDQNTTHDLINDITSLMRHYCCNPYGSDYSCAFCHEYEAPHGSEIKHADSCAGVRYLRELNESLSDSPPASGE